MIPHPEHDDQETPFPFLLACLARGPQTIPGSSSFSIPGQASNFLAELNSGLGYYSDTTSTLALAATELLVQPTRFQALYYASELAVVNFQVPHTHTHTRAGHCFEGSFHLLTRAPRERPC
jgi:hypothetical protein